MTSWLSGYVSPEWANSILSAVAGAVLWVWTPRIVALWRKPKG